MSQPAPSAADDTPPDLRILSPGASPHDVAAVTAVLRTALDNLAANAGADSGPAVSAWLRDQRPIRGSISAGAGAWRGIGF